MATRQPLGRGLSSLLSSGRGGGHVLQDISLSSISPNRNQPRKRLDPAKLASLVSSIKEQGVTTPVIVRRASQGFELIAGERRWRAAREAGLKTVPAIVREASDRQSLVLALVENIQREDLNPMEEAASYQMLLKELTQEELAKQLGRDRTTVTNTLRLLKLPAEAQEALRGGRITAGHARAILQLDTAAAQLQLFRRIVRRDLSVRQAEEAAQRAGHHGAKRKPVAGGFRGVEQELSRALGTKVRIRSNGKKGTIAIRFFSEEELERLIALLNKAGR